MKNNIQASCPLCDKETTILYEINDFNRKVSLETFQYNVCSHCQYLFLVNIPANLNEYYEADYYQFPTKEKLSKISAKNKYKIDLIKKYNNGNKLLEIGPAFGVFASLASSNGFQVDVIERDKACCNYMNINNLCRCIINSDEPLNVMHKLGNYDVVTMWHVFEHLKAPFNLLVELINKINSGGLLVIAVPNPESIQLKYMRKYWPHIDAPRHLQLISIQGLVNKLSPLNMRLVTVSYSGVDGFRWNLFSWQRLFMNVVNNKLLKICAYVIGTMTAIVMSPVELFNSNSAAYIAVFEKSK